MKLSWLLLLVFQSIIKQFPMKQNQAKNQSIFLRKDHFWINCNGLELDGIFTLLRDGKQGMEALGYLYCYVQDKRKKKKLPLENYLGPHVL